MKSYSLLCLTVANAVLMTACATKAPKPKRPYTSITLPSVVKAPDFTNLSTKSCVNGEYIHTPAVLSLNQQGKVTQVSGLKLKDKYLASQISHEFKKARYTPYRKNGTPLAHHLNVAISLKCPAKRR